MTDSLTRSVVATASVVAASLAVASSGLGAVRPDDRAGHRGVGGTGATASEGAGIRGTSGVNAHALRPDDRTGFRGVEQEAVSQPIGDQEPGLSARPDNRAGPLGEPGAVEMATQALVLAPNTGFDWGAASAGAGGGIGLTLLLATAAATLRRSHRRTGTAA